MYVMYKYQRLHVYNIIITNIGFKFSAACMVTRALWSPHFKENIQIEKHTGYSYLCSSVVSGVTFGGTAPFDLLKSAYDMMETTILTVAMATDEQVVKDAVTPT